MWNNYEWVFIAITSKNNIFVRTGMYCNFAMTGMYCNFALTGMYKLYCTVISPWQVCSVISEVSPPSSRFSLSGKPASQSLPDRLLLLSLIQRLKGQYQKILLLFILLPEVSFRLKDEKFKGTVSADFIFKCHWRYSYKVFFLWVESETVPLTASCQQPGIKL